MKLLIVLQVLACLFIAGCWAAPQRGKAVEVVENEVDNSGIGGYKFKYILSDGTTRTEEAVVNNPGTENESLTIRGNISWIAPDGVKYTIEFVADENGYRPEGAHLPKLAQS